MAVADLTRIKRRIIQLLGANGGSYGTTVDGAMGAFPYDQELLDAILEADAQVVIEAYFAHPTLSSPFYTTSGELDHGAALPSFCGQIGKVELKTAAAVWEQATDAASKDDVVNLVRYGATYLGAANIEGLYFISQGGYIYHTSTKARVQYPVFIKTTVPQALDMHESAVIAGALAMLYKHGSPLHSEPAFQFYTQFFETQKARIAVNQNLDDTPTIGDSN